MDGEHSQDRVEAPTNAVKGSETSTDAELREQTSPAEAPADDTDLDRPQERYSDTEAIPAGLPGLAMPNNQDSSVKLAELEVLTELTVMDLEEQERQHFPARWGPLPRWQPEQYRKGWWREGDNSSYARGRPSDDWGFSIRRSEPSGAASRDSGWDDDTIGWRGHTADGWNVPAVPSEDEDDDADRKQRKEMRSRRDSSSEESAEATKEGKGEVLDKKEHGWQ